MSDTTTVCGCEKSCFARTTYIFIDGEISTNKMHLFNDVYKKEPGIRNKRQFSIVL